MPHTSHGTCRRRFVRRPATLAATAVAVLIAAACSHETTHRVLVFFYDGVPPLSAGVADLGVEMPEGLSATATGESLRRVKATKKFYTHPLYWDNRCGSCHGATGRLLKTVREGLCQTCHFKKPEEKKKHIHGPVAVSGCLACHRYHKSRHEKILVADPQTLCFHCHETDELSTDKHHATIETERCIDCHDPHGGDDRFFLLPGVVTDGPS